MNKNWLYLLLLLAMITRGGLIIRVGQHEKTPWDGVLQTPDSRSYKELGDWIARDGYFGSYSGFTRWKRAEETPEIFRTPGYPAFLALVYTGLAENRQLYRFASAGEDYVVATVQILIDAALVGLTYWLGAMLVGPKVGLLAGFLQAISPLAVASSCRILSDSLYAFGFTAAVLLMVAHLQRGKWWMLAVAAIALGAACYVRPVAQIMAPIFALALLFRPFRAQQEKAAVTQGVALGYRIRARQALRAACRRLANAFVFLLIFAACVAPWIVRNGVRADYWGFSSVFGETLFYFAAPEVITRDENITDSEARTRLVEPWFCLHDIDSVYSVLYVRMRRNRALEIISAHPWTYAKLHAKGCLAFWLPGTDALEIAGLTKGNRGTLEVLHKDGLWAATKHYFGDSGWAIALAVPIAIFTLVQYLAGLLCVGRWLRGAFRTRAGIPTDTAKPGIAPGFRGGNRGQSPVLPSPVLPLGLIVLVSCLVSGTTGTPRFRVPVEPILNVAAAAGIVGLLARRGNNSRPASRHSHSGSASAGGRTAQYSTLNAQLPRRRHVPRPGSHGPPRT